MPSIAASSAFLDEGKLLSQHQAALTLLQQRLSDPDLRTLSWLDLACGRGQIFLQLEKNVSSNFRSKIVYHGYDINNDYVRVTENAVSQLALQSVKVWVGELPVFSSLIDGDLTFDFVTLTNTTHEIEPHKLATILFDALSRLKDDGWLYVYDMEQLNPPELGAVPWKKSDIETVIGTLLSSVGVKKYQPAVSHWEHSTVDGWSLQIDMDHIIREAPSFRDHRQKTLTVVTTKVQEILETRLRDCKQTLESLTKFGSATGAEKGEGTAGLYEYWALQRALENIK
jgi:ubiquinone/menaquinone biosynthesis C-methylase UbiE